MGVLGEEVVFWQVEFVDQVGDLFGVFMVVVEQQYCLVCVVWCWVVGWLVVVEEFYFVVGGEM